MTFLSFFDNLNEVRISKSSVQKWNELENQFMRLRSDVSRFAESPVSWKLLSTTERTYREQLLNEYVRPLQGTVIGYLCRRVEGAIIPDLTSEQTWMANMILVYCQSFVGEVCPLTMNGRFPFFEFPTDTVKEFAIFLIQEWWPEFGWSLLVSHVETKTDDILKGHFSP